MFSRLAVVIWSLALLAGAARAVVLAEDGKARATIVLAGGASRAALRSAEVLQSHLQQISGAKLLVRFEQLHDAEKAQRETFILLGEGPLSRKLGFSREGLGAGGMLAEVQGNVVALLGTDNTSPSDPWGTLYATVQFLEKLGVRYLWPGELGKVVPRSRTVRIEDFQLRSTPALAQRQIRLSSYNPRERAGLIHLHLTRQEYDTAYRESRRTTAETPGWFQWQGMGGTLNIAGGHAFDYLWKKYGAEHPDWFALQPDGTRGDGSRLCKSNPDLIAAIVRDKIEEIDKNPQLLGVSICPNDGSHATFCTCPNCESLDAPNGRKVMLRAFPAKAPSVEFEHVSLTDRMVYFWNSTAEQVKKARPGKLLTIDAYSAYTAPPLLRKLDPSLVVRFASLDYYSEASRQQGLRDWDGWAAMTQRIYFRSNCLLAGRRSGLPLLFPHRFAEDFRHLASHGMMGTDLDSCMENWATQGLNFYVASRLHWNPELDVEATIDDYCRAGFGPAAKTMRRYYDRLEAAFTAAAKGEAAEQGGFSDATLAELHQIMVQAEEEAAPDADALARVQFVALGERWTQIETRAHRLLPPATPTPEQIKMTLDERFAFMREVFEKHPTALNVAAISWGEDAEWGALNYRSP